MEEEDSQMMQMQGKCLFEFNFSGSDMDGSPYGMEEDLMGEDGMEYGQEQDPYGMEGENDGSGQYG